MNFSKGKIEKVFLELEIGPQGILCQPLVFSKIVENKRYLFLYITETAYRTSYAVLPIQYKDIESLDGDIEDIGPVIKSLIKKSDKVTIIDNYTDWGYTDIVYEINPGHFHYILNKYLTN